MIATNTDLANKTCIFTCSDLYHTVANIEKNYIFFENIDTKN